MNEIARTIEILRDHPEIVPEALALLQQLKREYEAQVVERRESP